jgi:hypothetical protein
LDLVFGVLATQKAEINHSNGEGSRLKERKEEEKVINCC